jgi:hypothetical protein
MMQHVWSVFCESSSIDEDKNAISLFNALETISVNGNPGETIMLPIDTEIVSLWARGDDGLPCKGKVEIWYRDPVWVSTLVYVNEIDLSESEFQGTRIRSKGIQVSTAGRYIIEVQLQNEGEDRWQTVARLPFIVKFIQDEDIK